MSNTPSGPARSARPAGKAGQASKAGQPGKARAGQAGKGGNRPTQRTTRGPARRPAPAAPPSSSSGIPRFRQRHPVMSALVPVAIVIAALVALVVIKTTGGPSGGTPAASHVVSGTNAAGTATGASALPAGVLSDVTSVSPSTFAAIGDPSGVSGPVATSKKTPLLRADGKPEVVYVGAEFCPFCAAQRWAVVVALSRFGTFSGLQATHSSTSDIYPDTRSFSFYGSTYSSPYVDFAPVEEQTNQLVGGNYTTLQVPTAAENAVLTRYDAAPYTTEPGSIPFLDIGNKFISVGASYNPQVLQGLSMREIAAQLNNKNSVVATAIDGAANQIVADITAITGVQPGTAAATTTTPTTAAAGTPTAGG
jgi:thiol-disulfide isomerase/thioredoxin